MGLLSKLKSKSPTTDADSTFTENSSAPLTSSTSTDPSDTSSRKKSFYEKYQERKRGPSTSNMTDEELFKATGKTREEFDAWKQTASGVGGRQAAGDITAGGHSGIGLSDGAGSGLGGWGLEAGKVSKKDDGVIR